MEFKGTKWKWYKGVTSDVKQVGTKKVVADCCFFGDDKMIEHANAQLIAHAPEMLEMLSKVNDRLIRRTLPTESEVNQFAKDIQDIIKRATTI